MKKYLLMALLAFGGTYLAGVDSTEGLNEADLECETICAFHEDVGNYTFIVIKNNTKRHLVCKVVVPELDTDYTTRLSPKMTSGLLKIQRLDWTWKCMANVKVPSAV